MEAICTLIPKTEYRRIPLQVKLLTIIKLYNYFVTLQKPGSHFSRVLFSELLNLSQTMVIISPIECKSFQTYGRYD